jgi:hypothetical protein
MVCATFGLRHNMVNGEVSEWEVVLTTGADTLLLAIQFVLMRAVVRQLLTTLRNVVSTDNLTEKTDFLFQADSHEFIGAE